MQTIDELKQEALAREQKQADAVRAAKAENLAQIFGLREWLVDEYPFGGLAGEIQKVGMGEFYVVFELSGHARFGARFNVHKHGREAWVLAPLNGDWRDRNRWRVYEWSGTWCNEDNVWQAKHQLTPFEDLGEALLAAERAFVEPAVIEQKIADANARQAAKQANEDALSTMAPEPTTAEIALDALKQLIGELVDQRLNERQYSE